MRNDLTLYHTPSPSLARQRLWLTLHVSGYVLFCLMQTVLLPFGPLALALRLFLCMTVVLHVGWLYLMGLYASGRCWQRIGYIPQPVPLLIDGDTSSVRRTLLAHDDFWYRWHDVG